MSPDTTKTRALDLWHRLDQLEQLSESGQYHRRPDPYPSDSDYAAIIGALRAERERALEEADGACAAVRRSAESNQKQAIEWAQGEAATGAHGS